MQDEVVACPQVNGPTAVLGQQLETSLAINQNNAAVEQYFWTQSLDELYAH